MPPGGLGGMMPPRPPRSVKKRFRLRLKPKTEPLLFAPSPSGVPLLKWVLLPGCSESRLGRPCFFFRPCHRKRLVLYFLKFQRNDPENAPIMESICGKTGKRYIFHHATEIKQPNTLTEPFFIWLCFSKWLAFIGAASAKMVPYFLKSQRNNQKMPQLWRQPTKTG